METENKTFKLPTPRHLVLDLDGTIIDAQIDRLMAGICAALSLPPTCKSQLLELHRTERLHLAAPEMTPTQLWTKISEELEKLPSTPHILPDVERTIKQARRNGASVSIATARSCPRRNVESIIERVGLSSLIDKVYLPTEFPGPFVDKTNMLLSAANEAGAPVKACCMVGDSSIDIISARNAQFGGCVAVLSGGVNQSVLKNSQPTYIVPSLGHIGFC